MANEAEEFARSHQHGWGRIPLQKQEGNRVFRAMAFTGPNEDSKVHLELITASKVAKETTYSLKYVMDNAVWFRPESKYVNTDNFVIRSVAFPQRQFSKVLTADNTYFSTAIPVKLPAEVEKRLCMSVLDVMQNFDKAYPTYDACYGFVTRGSALAVAFARRFLLMLHKEAEFPLLVYRNKFIGYDRGDTLVLPKSSENLSDTLRTLTGKGVIIQ